MSKDRNEAAIKAEEHLLRQPDRARELEALLRSGKLVLGGFMGWDDRELYEVIEEDLRAVWGEGRTVGELAARMAELTEAGIAGLGNPVMFGGFEITVEENKGLNFCPWDCQDHLSKRVTVVKRMKDGKSLRWADLSIHMIRRHGFFEGKGSLYRLEPKELIGVVFG
jgi:hypothetical protein